MNHKGPIQYLPKNLGLSRGKYLRYPITDLAQINEAAINSIEKSGAVETLYFWGVAHKKEPDKFDIDCLNMLTGILERLKVAFNSNVKLTLLLSDLHGFSNDFSESHVYNYLNSVKKLAERLGFQSIYLSSLFERGERQELNTPQLNKEEDLLYKVNFNQLIKGALKTGNAETSQERALQYMLLRCREREKIKYSFPNCILLNGDRKENKFLLPELPMIHIYNTGFRKSHKAWFLSEQIK